MEEMKAAPVVKLDTLSDVNDIGKPWRFEEDGLTVTRLSPWSAPGCHPTGCGLKVYTDGEDRVVKVEGDENHPVTQGRLCVRCLTLMDYMYNPSRIIYPMKRDPEKRGDADAWERCTWDEAVAIIKENYDRITKQYGRESCVCFTGTGREGGTFNPYGSVMLGTPNYCYTQSGYACYIPRLAASSYIIGSAYPEIDYACALPGRFDDPAYELPECLIMWGKMPLSSNGDGLFGHAVIDMMRRGTRLIMVDPRMNWLASRADIHLRLRAGTDTALAMGLLSVIINEDLYDHEYVEYWCYGFDELKARIKALLRRSRAGQKQQAQPDSKLVCGHITLDRDARDAYNDGQLVDLTAKEFDLMELLMRNPNRVYSRESLLNAIWGYDTSSDIRTVDVHIRRLREKLERSPAAPEHIMTKWGVGYYFTDKD